LLEGRSAGLRPNATNFLRMASLLFCCGFGGIL
jgi:hypothetical protein